MDRGYNKENKNVGMLERVNHQKVIQSASEARSKLKNGNLIPVPVEKIAEIYNIQILYNHCEGGISGYLFRDTGDTAIIGVNSKHRRTRQRFTLGHELGHYILHSKPSSQYVDKTFFIINRDKKSAEGFDTKEIEANLFAAELLMPAEHLYRDITRSKNNFNMDKLCSELAKRYEVSNEAMKFRLANLGFIKI